MSFEVLDCLDSLVGLVKRSPTLDGSVPVRVARGCVPLLDGNAFGWQLTLTRPLVLTRRLGTWRASWEPSAARDLDRLHRGAVPRLGVEGWTSSKEWREALERGVAVGSRHGVRLFTGLLVKPGTGTWLRVSSTANRRNGSFEVTEQMIADDGAYVPLVLDLRLFARTVSPVRLEGEIATLAPFAPDVHFDHETIANAPELARAHAAFYDRAYFEDKKDDVTGKYRRLVADPPAADDNEPARCRVVTVGAAHVSVDPIRQFVGPGTPRPETRPPRLHTVTFANEISFSARYDGHTLALEYDQAALRRKAAAVERAFAQAAGPAAAEHEGAALYLTKYFTPHPPGEPHFFVKPWAFVQTPPGWSCLLEGQNGDGYDVLRGVVATDVFYATPAVFHVRREGSPIKVREGEPLLRVIPFPRRLLGEDFRLRRL